MDLQHTFADIQRRVAIALEHSGRFPSSLRIVAATKTHPASLLRQATALGISDFGENYVQELVAKFEELKSEAIQWHFIGHLQSNKVKLIAPFVHCIHSVDSLHLAQEISRQAQRFERNIAILVQINTSGEESKSGLPPNQALDLVSAAHSLPGIKLQGLMAIPEAQDDPELTRPEFQLLAALAKQIRHELGLDYFTELSMGMSSDFECAIEEGATMIRLGTILFGEREYAQTPEVK